MSNMVLRPCSKSNPDNDPVIVERWNGKDWSEVEVTRNFYIVWLAPNPKDFSDTEKKKALDDQTRD